jgi:hypothetical protein
VRSYRNPFRSRTSEQETRQGLQRFLRTYGAGALDLLPEEVWDRLVVLQSAPGAGKTSLMRIFTSEALREIAEHADDLPELHERMTAMEAVEDGQIRILGVRLALKKDYQSIDDLRIAPDSAVKVFFRLLDAHIVRRVVEALIDATGAEPEALGWEPGADGAPALERLGGRNAANLLKWSIRSERELLDRLDSVLPQTLTDLRGHHAPYSIRALGGATFTHDGRVLEVRPLLMFDDGQDLGPHQRRALLQALVDRDLDLHRWYAERYQALSAEEIIADGEPGRAYTPIRIEEEAREMGDTSRRGHRTRRFDRLLLDIANRRASNALRTDADEDRPFTGLLDDDRDDARLELVVSELRARLAELAEGNPRYDTWLQMASDWHGYDGAVSCRLLEILIVRDRDRRQDTLFAMPLTEEEFKARSASDLREAAALFLKREFALPFYAGVDRLTKLASENIEQHLNLSGELFEEILACVTLGHPLSIDAARQEAIVWRTSETLWRDIPKRRAHGRDIQRLLLHIAAVGRRETYRAKASYPPGVTGTAISMRDRQLLLDPAWRAKTPGSEELFEALAGAIGHNLLRADLDYAVKNDRWMVLYLNRLLCVRFGLPLGFGGFRERPVAQLCDWMREPLDDHEMVEAPVQQEFAL